MNEAEPQALEYGNNKPCPACKSFVQDNEHYLLIQEYVTGMKRGKFRIHFDCWKNQYTNATKQWFDMMGEIGQTLYTKFYDLLKSGKLSPEELRESILKVAEQKKELLQHKPEDYLNTKKDKRGLKKQHGDK